jgi:hypothetical protein
VNSTRRSLGEVNADGSQFVAVIGRCHPWDAKGGLCPDFDQISPLALFVVSNNLANFLRRLSLPTEIKHCSLRSLLVKLIKIGAKVVHSNRYVTFQMAEVAVSRDLFAPILLRIERLRGCTA